VHDFSSNYSTISFNSAEASQTGEYALGGGVATHGYAATIVGSTVVGNTAERGGGIFFNLGLSALPAVITNSTISGNTGTFGFGGIYGGVPLTVRNSTIAFNAAPLGVGFGGAGLNVFSGAPLTLQSSIIADNWGPQGPSDIAGSGGSVITAGSSHNLVTSSTLPLPAMTLQDCPKLQPLAKNGGPTLTHALHHSSPALDNGNNTAGLVTDQRLAPRTVNGVEDIGAVEWQASDIDERIMANGFDGLCDQ
jgi:hypothetical protein